MNRLDYIDHTDYPYININLDLPIDIDLDDTIVRLQERKVEIPISLSALEDALLQRDFVTIIENSELFWQAFCKALGQTQKDKSNVLFSISLSKDLMILSGDEDALLSLQKCIEEIRKLFAKKKDKSSFFIVPISIAMFAYVRERAEVVDLTNWLDDSQSYLNKSWFDELIRPAMQNFCKSIGANCLPVEFYQKVITNTNIGIVNEKVQACKIFWVEDDRVFPIPPKIISPREDFGKSLYHLYQKQLWCDFSLIAKDGVANIHLPLLLAYGGETIQQEITKSRGISRTLSLEKYSLSTVNGLIDFLYLWEDALKKESFSQIEDLNALFDLSVQYGMKTLMNFLAKILNEIKQKKLTGSCNDFPKKWHELYKKFFYTDQIPCRDDLSKCMYFFYQQQRECDFSLIAKDGTVKIHSLILLTYGGEAIRSMLLSNMKESSEKVFYLKKYSSKTIEAFVAFLYLGEEVLDPETFPQKEIDLCALLDLADMYQINPLIDCCTNLISLFSSPEDAEKIIFLADRYKNDHLQVLKEYYQQKEENFDLAKNFAKV